MHVLKTLNVVIERYDVPVGHILRGYRMPTTLKIAYCQTRLEERKRLTND